MPVKTKTLSFWLISVEEKTLQETKLNNGIGCPLLETTMKFDATSEMFPRLESKALNTNLDCEAIIINKIYTKLPQC